MWRLIFVEIRSTLTSQNLAVYRSRMLASTAARLLLAAALCASATAGADDFSDAAAPAPATIGNGLLFLGGSLNVVGGLMSTSWDGTLLTRQVVFLGVFSRAVFIPAPRT